VIWVYLIAAGAIIGGALFAVHSYNSAIEDAAEARLETKKIAGERDGWIDEAARQEAAAHRQEQVIKAREVERARLQRERDDARTSLADLLRQPDVKAWADADLPAAVADRLRGGGVAAPASGPAKGAAPGKPDGGDAGAVIRGPNERRPAQPPR
jgi:hypothetical protein